MAKSVNTRENGGANITLTDCPANATKKQILEQLQLAPFSNATKLISNFFNNRPLNLVIFYVSGLQVFNVNVCVIYFLPKKKSQNVELILVSNQLPP